MKLRFGGTFCAVAGCIGIPVTVVEFIRRPTKTAAKRGIRGQLVQQNRCEKHAALRPKKARK